jgi:hypothetical protein
MPSLPVIDFSVFYSGTEVQRAKLAATIAEELKNHGAMRLINTSISASTIEEGFKWVSPYFFQFFKVMGLEKGTDVVLFSTVGQEVLLAPQRGKGGYPQRTQCKPPARLELCGIGEHVQARYDQQRGFGG